MVPVRRAVRRSFTLIELLVVIAIIAILASMLLPSLTRAKDSAHKITCSGRLKQLGMAVIMYAENNEERLPKYSVSVAADGWGPYSWQELTHPYVKTARSWSLDEAFRCPKLPTYYNGFGANWRHTIAYQSPNNWAGVDSTIGMYKNPSKAMVLCDAHNGVTTGGPYEGTSGYSAVYCKHCYPSSAYNLINQAVSSRHGLGANCVYMDGHASWHKTMWIVNNLDTATSIWAHYNP